MPAKRKCPVTNETFQPNNPDQFFFSVGAFFKYINDSDPLDDIGTEKREIHWTPQKRIDPRNGKEFLATHPAQIYAPDEEPVVTEKRNNPNEHYEPYPYTCQKCGRQFLREKPAMKYCEECSESGGKLL